MNREKEITNDQIIQTRNTTLRSTRDKEQKPIHTASKMPRILHSITKLRKKKQQKLRYRNGEQTRLMGRNTYASTNTTRGKEGRKSRATEALRDNRDLVRIDKLFETTHWPPDFNIGEKP